MIIPKLQILAESENWIVVTDRSVTRQTLFNLLSFGKVAVTTFPLKNETGKVKGVALLCFGNSHDEHKSLSVPECLIYDRMKSLVKDISTEKCVVGCYFDISARYFVSRDGGYGFRAYETTFSRSSSSYGNQLFKRFDVRRLLRVWCQSLFEFTACDLSDDSNKKNSDDGGERKVKDILISLQEETEYCLEFMSLNPTDIFGDILKNPNFEKREKIVQNAFSIIT